MAAVGAYLREFRVKRGLSLDDLSRATRIPRPHLESLENDAFSSMPAPVFIRGFIRAYCQAVGASPDDALARFDGREVREGAPAPAPGARATVGPSTASTDGDQRTRSAILVSFVLLVVLGVALFAVALVTQPAREHRVERAPVPPSPAPGAATPPVAAITSAPDAATRPIPPPTAKPPVRPPEPARPAAPSASAVGPVPPFAAAPVAPSGSRPWLPQVQSATSGVSTPYRLVARVSEPTWIRVRTEDGRTSEETVPAGAVREWVSNRPFVVTIGNAGGVSFELNGRSLPSFGASGAVISGLVLPPEAARSQ